MFMHMLFFCHKEHVPCQAITVFCTPPAVCDSVQLSLPKVCTTGQDEAPLWS